MKPGRNAVCIFLLFAAAAGADDELFANDGLHPLMTTKVWISAGAFFAARDFDASAHGQGGVVTPVLDFESALGLDDKPELLTLEANWMFGKNWGLSFQHFQAERDSTRTLEEDFEWDGVVYEVGVDLFAESRIDITRVMFTRFFRGDGPHQLRLGAGLHMLKLGVELAGEARLEDNSQEFRRSIVKADSPFPTFGAWYRYSFNDRWMLSARLDWFSASFGDIRGAVWNAAAGAHYAFTENIGLGLTWQLFEINARVRETHWTGRVRTRLTGPNLQLSVFF